LAEIKQRPLTGDVSFNDVRKVLDDVENPKGEDNRINLIIATSMISHGVDIDKLNFMVFMGMPRNTAEYIQASSRVGRKHPGLVFVLFNPTRERDQSYFKFFTKFHEYKDLLVEAVPINRWAKFSINRTIPGVFAGAILNYYDIKAMPIVGKSINMSKPFEKAFNQGVFTEEEIKEFLCKSYKIDKEHLGLGIEFKEIISKKTNSYIHEISQNLGNDFITKPMSEKPMMSLRDVDTLVDINLSPDGMMVLKNIKASRTVSYDDDEEDEDVKESE
jgi:superfamily II DNA/RNA helicase